MANMDAEAPAVYGLKFQARCIAPRLGLEDKSGFLVGTLNLQENNEVHVLDYDNDSNTLVCGRILAHQHEVWRLAASPMDPSQFLSVYNTPAGFASTLWKIPDEDGSTESPLEVKCHLETHSGPIAAVLWDPSGDTEKVVSVDHEQLRLFDMGAATGETASATASVPMDKAAAAVWNPHHVNQIVVATETTMRGIDLRTKKEAFVIKEAHAQCVRDVDFNPNRPYVFVTGGDDAKMRFWDSRKPSDPLKTLSHHSHWILNTKYNPFHDQLLISSSTDCRVNLYNVKSLSSAPLGGLDDEEDDGSEQGQDSLIKTYYEHEDSVYSTVWSCSETDAWVFASLSYDGRVVVNHVPSQEKYKILL